MCKKKKSWNNFAIRSIILKWTAIWPQGLSFPVIFFLSQEVSPVLASLMITSDSLYSFATYVLCLVTQLFLTLCDPIDCIPPGFSVYGILQARILESVAMPSSRGSSQPRDWTQGGEFFTISATRETQEYWSG